MFYGTVTLRDRSIGSVFPKYAASMFRAVFNSTRFWTTLARHCFYFDTHPTKDGFDLSLVNFDM